MKWMVIHHQRECRDRAGIKVMRGTSTLRHYAGGEHTLTGYNGAVILEAIAEQWNREGRESPEPTTCRADHLTESGRKSYTLSIP